MAEDAEPQNSYERKLKLILDIALKRFHGEHTQEQYALELKVARDILKSLGVTP